MKKLTSLICTIALMFSFLPMPVLAAEPATGEPEVIEIVVKNGEIVPTATSKGLAYYENVTILQGEGAGTPLVFTVTPEKGANLRIWLNNTEGPARVAVGRTGLLGWVGIYDKVFEPGERDVLITSDSNGQPYQVKVSATDLYTTLSILVYQN